MSELSAAPLRRRTRPTLGIARRVFRLLILLLFYCHLIESASQQQQQQQQQTRASSQHALTRFYHEVQQNEIYRRMDAQKRPPLPPSAINARFSLRQVSVPLLSELRADERARPADLKQPPQVSKNNRGSPADAGKQRRPHAEDEQHRFGERRRRHDADEPRHAERPEAVREARELVATRAPRLVRKSGAANWSQPDPRRSYSLPVQLAPVGANLARHSLNQLAGASRRLAAAATASTKRNEPLDSSFSFVSSSEPTSFLASSTPATSAGFDSSESEHDVVSEQAGHQLNYQPLQQQHLKAASSGQPLVFGGRQTPLLTLIKYVPVLMNVPASQVAVLASSGERAPARPQQLVALASKHSGPKVALVPAASSSAPASLLDHLYRPAQAHTLQEGAKYQLIEPLAAEAVGKQPAAQLLLEQATGNELVGGAQEYAQLEGGAILAGGQQLTRLAYVPVGPAQLAMPAGQAASKALSAYASRLLAMLRPSALLSSIGAGGGAGATSGQHLYGQHPVAAAQQPQIYLLAPAEHVGGQAARSSSIASAGASSSPIRSVAKAEDTLMNQASKVHAQRQYSSNQQQQQQQQQREQAIRWPLSPQMNGLVCIQGLINAKQTAGKQPPSAGQEGQAHEESFSQQHEEQRPLKQPAAGKPAQAKGQPPQAAKTAKGQKQRRKESPIQRMQKLMGGGGGAGKLGSGEEQRARYNAAGNYDAESEGTPIVQQKLMSSSSDSSSSIFDERRQEAPSGGGGERRPTSLGREQEARSHIIPFTIRDKIEAPAGAAYRARAAQQLHESDGAPPAQAARPAGQRAQSNNAIQYDEPAESDLGLGAPADLEQRRSRTSFVAARANNKPAASSRQLAGGAEIDYKRDLLANGGGGGGPSSESNALPVLMASSSTGANFQPARNNQAPARLTQQSPPPPPPQSNLGAFANFHELLGASSSASSTIATITTSAVELAPSTAPPPVAASSLVSSILTRPGELSTPGRLISSISLAPGDLAAESRVQVAPASSRKWPEVEARRANNTIELVVNSTPARQLEQTTPASRGELELEHSSQLNITASPLMWDATTTSAATTTTTTTMSPRDETEADRSDLLASMNTFSHDRTLATGHNQNFSKISESLQTNPLDLIDLQNSRSSFALPAQLESLSMFTRKSF